ncbi:hypothetical protein TNCT_10721 [Trichonephila clavata]|uniref:Uncharacterized protein n=1 Tax=Trichonephila clavata TaxID=2740835 RepID=A0A8X6L266_TRICU|nr:hypothetical protein TNCT_10721 [Trichonephila clavata]
MKGRKRKCMASNIVRRSGLRKKPRTQEDDEELSRINSDSSAGERQMDESREYKLDRDLLLNLLSETPTRSSEDSRQEKSPLKPTRRIYPIRLCRYERTVFSGGSTTSEEASGDENSVTSVSMSSEVSRQEKSPSKPEQTPLRRSSRLQLKRKLSERSPKQMARVTGEQLSHSGPKKIPEKAKASKNKMTVSGKSSSIACTEDKQSKDISSGNISGAPHGLRRSSRFRVPPPGPLAERETRV